jgi:hypothetical protein
MMTTVYDRIQMIEFNSSKVISIESPHERKPFDRMTFARNPFDRTTFDQKPYDHLIVMNQTSLDQVVFNEFDVQFYVSDK